MRESVCVPWRMCVLVCRNIEQYKSCTQCVLIIKQSVCVPIFLYTRSYSVLYMCMCVYRLCYYCHIFWLIRYRNNLNLTAAPSSSCFPVSSFSYLHTVSTLYYPFVSSPVSKTVKLSSSKLNILLPNQANDWHSRQHFHPSPPTSRSRVVW